MKSLLAALFFLFTVMTASAQFQDTKYYEMRVYYCYPGKLDALIKRFTDHTTRIFEKHGMENIGYWIPVENKDNALYYILAYPSKEARDASWKAFGSDPEWKQVASKSEENGKIVERVVSTFMNRAELQPTMAAMKSSPDRLFELRIYNCAPGKFPDLITRFKNHAFAGFKKYGFENIGYWSTIEKDGGQPKLLYLLAFKDEATAKKKWEDFRADEEWKAAKAQSELKGKLVDSVQSVFMKPLSFSKIK